MGWFEWTAELDVGDDLLNEQHKKLLTIMQKLQDLADAQAAKSALLIALNELYTYTEKHFAAEEQFMAKMASPDFKFHSQAHGRLLRLLAHHMQDFKEFAGAEISQDFFEFLQKWLQTHTMAVDTRFALKRSDWQKWA